MKKVGLLTIHASYNYGAALQAYATQKNINDIGAECKIINFMTSDSKNSLKLLRFDLSKAALKHNIRNLVKLPSFFQRKKTFEGFKASRFSLTEKTYSAKNFKDIEKENFDCVITGSDQTLDLNIGSGGADRRCFYLPDINGRKISYSASMGEHINKITDDQKDFIKAALADYESLSVREEKTADFIEDLCGIRPEVLPDPTLTVPRQHWEDFAKEYPGLPKEYILFYTVLSDPWVIECVKEISKRTGLPIVAAHPQNSFEIGTSFIRADKAGPEQFVSMIKNASLVVTTSFHGTAFSVNLCRPFVSLILGEGNRISSLLDACGLDDRGFRRAPDADFDLFKIDFSASAEFLRRESAKSISFLKRSL